MPSKRSSTLSDTPRTDAVDDADFGRDFARQLERELAAALKENERVVNLHKGLIDLMKRMRKAKEELERSMKHVSVAAESGWQCPKCGRCWNPGKIQCDCSSERSLAERIRSAR
jgi:methionyl-tRNA synthetase